MIRIRYTAPYDLDISGSVQALQIISAAILDLATSDVMNFAHIADTNYDPTPYHSTLSGLLVTKADGRIAVTVEDEMTVLISGRSDFLVTLAAWFSFEPDTPPKTHVHFEYYDNHPLISPTSVPLVIGIE